MKFYDGEKVADIALYDGSGKDFTADFYEAGRLPYNEEQEAHVVESVDYLIDQADDYINGWNDYKCNMADDDTEAYIDGKKLERVKTWRPVTKDRHEIRVGDFIRTKNNNNLFEEVYDVDFDFVLTRGWFFDKDIDDWRTGPLTYVSRRELKHYTWG